MPFDPAAYGIEVERILALDGSGQRLMPLAAGRCSSEDARRILQSKSGRDLFPNSNAPDAALSGLWLYFSCLDESHNLSQNIPAPEGSFWHGIMHRQEPDPGNSAYWFRRVGSHSIFPALRDAAESILESNASARVSFPLQSTWDPLAFIDFCEGVRQRPGSADERAAIEIQRAEWQLLFDFCARPQR
jgi:hypothetical protein